MIAILAALHYRTVSGEGQSIDISMQDSVWALVFPDRADYFTTGNVPQRFGNQFASSVPFGSYNAKDGAVIICTIADAQACCPSGDRQGGFERDPRFSTRDNRVNNRDAVNVPATDSAGRERSSEVLTALKKNRSPARLCPVLTRLLLTPIWRAGRCRSRWSSRFPGSSSSSARCIRCPRRWGQAQIAPAAGEHNGEIYSGLLGISPREIRKLKEEGVV